VSKNDEGFFFPTMERYPFSKSIYLIDDQITKGTNARKSIEILQGIGVQNLTVFTWSASKFEKKD
jgi:glutamine phosphoribosylpyrophosphate amidotransferase